MAPAGCARRPPPVPVTLRPLDPTKLAEVVAEQRGKVVLVDFWATWCRPCMELFPHTVGLHEKWAGRGLAVISVSMDDLDEPETEPSVRKFLAENRASFDNYIARDAGSAATWDAMGLKGIMPQLKLFDRSGKLRHHFPETGTIVIPAEVDQAVEALLAEDLTSAGGTSGPGGP